MSEPEHWMISARGNRFSRVRQIGGSLLLILFGGIFLYFLVPEILSNLTAVRWVLTPCTILSSEVRSQKSSDREEPITLYRLDVRYSYETAAGRYESMRYRFIDPFTDDRAEAEAAAVRYYAGAVASCYVDPDDSTQAVLDRRLSPFILIVLLPAAFAGLGLWNLVGIGIEILKDILRAA